jgi:uncharacterized protein YjbI with pentapeptide repeats
LGRLENSPSKSVCSILPLARHLRAGELFCVSTPARGSSLLSSAALGGPILQSGLRFAPSLRDSGLSVTMPGGGTRPGVEVRDGPHNNNRCGSNRGGVAPTAAPLRPRSEPEHSGSGLYNALGRSVSPPCAAFALSGPLAWLRYADLGGAALDGADLSGVDGLTQKQIEQAHGD